MAERPISELCGQHYLQHNGDTHFAVFRCIPAGQNTHFIVVFNHMVHICVH